MLPPSLGPVREMGHENSHTTTVLFTMPSSGCSDEAERRFQVGTVSAPYDRPLPLGLSHRFEEVERDGDGLIVVSDALSVAVCRSDG